MKKVFEANCIGLALISEITSAIKAQYIYTSADKMKDLTVRLQIIMEELGAGGMWETVSVEELLPILNAVVLAQEKGDWIFLADILESDLRSFLQKFQIEVMERIEISRPDYFAKNMKILREWDKELWSIIMDNREIKHSKYVLMEAINGQVTMRYKKKGGDEVYVHSMIDPQAAAKEFAREYYDELQKDYCILGLGLGYHVLELLNMSKAVFITVMESSIEVILRALTFLDWSEFLQEGRLQIKYEQSMNKLLKAVSKTSVLLIYYPFLQCMETCQEKEALENYFVSTNSMREQKRDMDDNFFLLQSAGLGEGSGIISKISGKTLIIVAAGPSLERELRVLKEVQRNKDILILSVGTVAQKLVENEIYPDFILISDAYKEMYKQIENIKMNIPLLLLSTACAKVVTKYAGPCYIIYQKGYQPAERIAEQNNWILFSTGGSVATLAVDIGIRMQARKIIMVGTDMAYLDFKLHAFDDVQGVYASEALREVDGVDGGKVKTGKNLDIYRKWIEKRIWQSGESLRIYNASHGAKIQGTKEMSLWDAVND